MSLTSFNYKDSGVKRVGPWLGAILYAASKHWTTKRSQIFLLQNAWKRNSLRSDRRFHTFKEKYCHL